MPPITVPLRAPELGPGEWIQGPQVSMVASRGSVVLVDFWDYTCVNCLRTLPYLKAWHERYSGLGLTIVGVHTPEFEFTADPAVVAAAVRDLEIPYPVLLDDSKETWRLFANHYWPAKYLVDGRGYLRFEHFGEGAYGYIEESIQGLLREAGHGGDIGDMPPVLAPFRQEDRPGAVCYPATRETYVGYLRGRLLAAEGYRPGEEVRHRDDQEPAPPGMFNARGAWRHEAEYMEAAEAGAELELVCEAAGVNLVVSSAGGEIEIEMDGRPVPPEERGADVVERDGRTLAVWERPRMLWLVDSHEFRERRLRLRFRTPGTRAYAFTFTTCVQGPAPS